MPREHVIQTDRLRIPTELVTAYLRDFQNNLHAVSTHSGIAIRIIKRIKKGEPIDEDVSELFLQACYRRLGRLETDVYMGLKENESRTAAAEAILKAVDQLRRKATDAVKADDFSISPPYEVDQEELQGEQMETLVASEQEIVKQNCSHCGESYPATPEFFRRKSGADGITSICLVCNRNFGRQGAAVRKAKSQGIEPEALELNHEPTPIAFAPKIYTLEQETIKELREAIESTKESLNVAEQLTSTPAAEETASPAATTATPVGTVYRMEITVPAKEEQSNDVRTIAERLIHLAGEVSMIESRSRLIEEYELTLSEIRMKSNARIQELELENKMLWGEMDTALKDREEHSNLLAKIAELTQLNVQLLQMVRGRIATEEGEESQIAK